MLSNTVAQKITEEAKKEKACSEVQKTETPLAVNITIKMTLYHTLSPESTRSLRTTFSKKTPLGVATSVSAF